MIKVFMKVRGVERTVYLEKYLGGNKWLARTYVGVRGKTTVSGVYSVNTSGARRFTPKGINASLV